jgi:hypothetical protein
MDKTRFVDKGSDFVTVSLPKTPDDAEKDAVKLSRAVSKIIDKVATGTPLTDDERLALATQVRGKDTIDDLADEHTSKWRRVVDPIRAQIAKLAEEAKDEHDFKAKLAKLKLDNRTLVEEIAKATFTARVLGGHKDRP